MISSKSLISEERMGPVGVYRWAKSLLRWFRLWPEVPPLDVEGVTACELLQEAVWKGEPKCMWCKSTQVYRTNIVADDQQWKCRTCKKAFNIRTNTIMAGSRAKLGDWVTVLLAVQSEKPVWGEVARINRQTECGYATTGYMVEKTKNELNKNAFFGEIGNCLALMVRSKKWGLKRRKKDGFYSEHVYHLEKKRKLLKGAKNRHIRQSDGYHYTKGHRRKRA